MDNQHPPEDKQGPTPIQGMFMAHTTQRIYFIASLRSPQDRIVKSPWAQDDQKHPYRYWQWFLSEGGRRRALALLLQAVLRPSHPNFDVTTEVRIGSIEFDGLWKEAEVVPLLPNLPSMESSFIMISAPCRKNHHAECPGRGLLGEREMGCECSCGHGRG